MHTLTKSLLVLFALCISVVSTQRSAAADEAPSSFVVAHFTDIHLRKEHHSTTRFQAVVAGMRKEHPDISFVLNTGDILDGKKGKWAYWTDAVKAGMSDLPIYSLLGNHDHEADIKEIDALCTLLKMPSRYYAFDHKGYRFFMLDGNTIGREKKQIDWLKEKLKTSPKGMHVVVLCHQPLSGNKTITELLASYPNVKLCLAGHTHLYRRTQVKGIPYIEGGAVSGCWWEIEKSTDGKGGHKGTPPGFGLIKFHADGQFDYEYIKHGQ